MRCNRSNWLRLAGKYRRLELGDQCVYCGDPATTRDHFIPVSVVAMLADSNPVPQYAKVTLPCCSHCNSVAEAKVFKTVGAKRRYIQNRLAKKHRKLLNSPPWSDDEINQLGRTLRTKILADQQLARRLRCRIAWRNGSRSKIDAIGAPGALSRLLEENGTKAGADA